jgi:hypothetical protein
MKKYILTALIISFSTLFAFGQYGKSEFRYFSIKAGVTHSMFNPQPGGFSYLFLNTPFGDMQLKSTESYFDYVPGYYGGFIYNYDLKNDKVGFVVGLEYTQYGHAVQYKTTNELYTLTQKHMLSRASVPIYIKLGNRYYEKQNYLYLGMRYDRNLIYNKAEEVNWTSRVNLTNPGTDMIEKQNFTAIAGLNYMFLNFELNYVVGGFLNKEYSLFLDDGNTVKPYENYPSGNLFISTGVTVPLNSWSSRQVYLFNMWFRRVFK